MYGDQGELPITEESPLCPMSLYAVTKEANEKIAFCVSKAFPIILTPGATILMSRAKGRIQWSYAGVIPKFLKLIETKTSPTIFGTGNETEISVYFVKDLTRVLTSLLSLNSSQAQDFKALNVASGVSRSVLEIWNILLKVSNTNIEHSPWSTLITQKEIK